MTSKIALIISAIVALPFLMILFSFLKNDLPWTDPPGIGQRLSTYLNTNIAETTVDSVFPELIPRRYALDMEVLKQLIVGAVTQLGWDIEQDFDQEHILKTVVTTPLLGFKDDVVIKLQQGAGDTVVASIRSESRTGKGDLGTNTKHVIDLFTTLDSNIASAARQ